MGQGQEIIARKYMASATVEGQWVLLQNTHLGLGYLTEVRFQHDVTLRLLYHHMASTACDLSLIAFGTTY